MQEVLIVVAILGFTAAMTMPTIINNIQEQQYIVTWKKTYSDLSQVLETIKLNNGGDFSGIACKNEVGMYGHTLYPQLKKYLKKIEYGDGNSFYNSNSEPAFNYKSMNNTPIRYSLFDDGQILLSNGILLSVENPGLSTNWSSVIWADVNGHLKGPNIMGKDIFGLQLFYDRYLPLGAKGTWITYLDSVEDTCNNTSGEKSGMGCSAEYLYK